MTTVFFAVLITNYYLLRHKFVRFLKLKERNTYKLVFVHKLTTTTGILGLIAQVKEATKRVPLVEEMMHKLVLMLSDLYSFFSASCVYSTYYYFTKQDSHAFELMGWQQYL